MAAVLIIDDDPDLCTLVSTILKKDGYEVDTAASGRMSSTAMSSVFWPMTPNASAAILPVEVSMFSTTEPRSRSMRCSNLRSSYARL